MKCISTLVLTFTLAIAGVAHAGVSVWTAHGPYGYVNALAIDPTTPGGLAAG